MARFIISIIIFYLLIHFAIKVIKAIFLQLTDSDNQTQGTSQGSQKKNFSFKGDIEDAKFKDIDEK